MKDYAIGYLDREGKKKVIIEITRVCDSHVYRLVISGYDKFYIGRDIITHKPFVLVDNCNFNAALSQKRNAYGMAIVTHYEALYSKIRLSEEDVLQMLENMTADDIIEYKNNVEDAINNQRTRLYDRINEYIEAKKNNKRKIKTLRKKMQEQQKRIKSVI